MINDDTTMIKYILKLYNTIYISYRLILMQIFIFITCVSNAYSNQSTSLNTTALDLSSSKFHIASNTITPGSFDKSCLKPCAKKKNVQNLALQNIKRDNVKARNHLPRNHLPFAQDSRIKRYVYNPNSIYYIKLHFGFQSQIEFHPDEQIETISLGSPYSVKITPLNNRIFIKPLEQHMRTNMTVITNYRSYEFDLVSKTLEEDEENDLVYLIRFIYPSKKKRVRL